MWYTWRGFFDVEVVVILEEKGERSESVSEKHVKRKHIIRHTHIDRQVTTDINGQTAVMMISPSQTEKISI